MFGQVKLDAYISIYLAHDQSYRMYTEVNACYAFPEKMNKDVKPRTQLTQNCFIIYLPVKSLFP